MKVTQTNIPYTHLEKQIDLSGHKEFYTLSYHESEDTCSWDASFVNKLDAYLISPIQVTKSESRAIEEFLSHEDKHMAEQEPNTHEERVQESLDALFYQSTKALMYS